MRDLRRARISVVCVEEGDGAESEAVVVCERYGAGADSRAVVSRVFSVVAGSFSVSAAAVLVEARGFFFWLRVGRMLS